MELDTKIRGYIKDLTTEVEQTAQRMKQEVETADAIGTIESLVTIFKEKTSEINDVITLSPFYIRYMRHEADQIMSRMYELV